MSFRNKMQRDEKVPKSKDLPKLDIEKAYQALVGLIADAYRYFNYAAQFSDILEEEKIEFLVTSFDYFVQYTQNSHWDRATLNLMKLYDTHFKALSIKNFLTCLKSSDGSLLRDISINQIEVDISRIDDILKNFDNKLKIIRDKVYAHLDIECYEALQKREITFKENIDYGKNVFQYLYLSKKSDESIVVKHLKKSRDGKVYSCETKIIKENFQHFQELKEAIISENNEVSEDCYNSLIGKINGFKDTECNLFELKKEAIEKLLNEAKDIISHYKCLFPNTHSFFNELDLGRVRDFLDFPSKN